MFFVMLHSECFIGVYMAALKADVSFYGLDIYISSFYLGRFVYFLDGYLSLFVLSFSLIWCSLQL